MSSASGGNIVGASIKRREDPRFITGKGQYTDDLKVPGMVYAAFVRSPHANARIRSIEVRPAKNTPGIRAVFTGRDLADGGVNPIPVGWLLAGMKLGERRAIAIDRVRYVGEAVAMVLAETPQKEPYLTVLGSVDGQALTLYPNQPVQVGNNEYTFGGRREFAGIEVRRDPGAKFIWIATGLLITGLLVTFYVPRLRLWARVQGDETVIAAQAERRGPFQSEMKRLQKELGALEAEVKRGDQPHA